MNLLKSPLFVNLICLQAAIAQTDYSGDIVEDRGGFGTGEQIDMLLVVGIMVFVGYLLSKKNK